MVEKSFFNPHDDVDLQIIPRGRQKGHFFIYFTLFLHYVMTIFQKKKRRDHPN